MGRTTRCLAPARGNLAEEVAGSATSFCETLVTWVAWQLPTSVDRWLASVGKSDKPTIWRSTVFGARSTWAARFSAGDIRRLLQAALQAACQEARAQRKGLAAQDAAPCSTACGLYRSDASEVLLALQDKADALDCAQTSKRAVCCFWIEALAPVCSCTVGLQGGSGRENFLPCSQRLARPRYILSAASNSIAYR